MSTELPDAEAPAAETELKHLASLVRRLLKEWEQFRTRADVAESRVRELESALRDVASGGIDPVALTQRVASLEQENRFLARRLDTARVSVKRISARLQFLDEER
jgi:hypothetical protein